jgi:hypothetical protein
LGILITGKNTPFYSALPYVVIVMNGTPMLNKDLLYKAKLKWKNIDCSVNIRKITKM